MAQPNPVARIAAFASVLLFLSAIRGAEPEFAIWNGELAKWQVVSNGVTVTNSAEVSVGTSFPLGQIFFTTDGAEPSPTSPRYASALLVTNTSRIRATSYNSDFSARATNQLDVRVIRTHDLAISSGGPITVTPAGPSYAEGTVVTLAAYDTNGWSFHGWLEPVESTNRTITVVMNSDQTVRANFLVKLTVRGTAGGHVEVYPAGEVPEGATVRLTAAPNSGYSFAAWGGAALGSVNPLTWPLTHWGGTVSAAFAPLESNQVTLTALLDGPGRLEVEPRQNVFTKGETVKVHIALSGAEFLGWSGDASGFANPLEVALNQSKTVRATTAPLTELYHPGASLPTIGNDGTLYTTLDPGGGEFGTLLALSKDFQTKWALVTEQQGLSTAVGKNGTVYVGAENGDVSAVRPDGTIFWRFRSGEPLRAKEITHFGAPLAVAADETVYCSSRFSANVYVVRNGTLLRTNAPYLQFDVLAPSLPLIGPDGTLYLPTTFRSFVAQNPRTGRVVWTNALPLPAAIDNRGVLYCVDDEALTAVSFGNSNLWRLPIPNASPKLFIGENRVLYMERAADMLAISAEGKVLWTNGIAGRIAPTENGGVHSLSGSANSNGSYVEVPITSALYNSAGELSRWGQITVGTMRTWHFRESVLAPWGEVYSLAADGRGTWVQGMPAFARPARSSWNALGGNAQRTRRADSLLRILTVTTNGPGTAIWANEREYLLYAEVAITAQPRYGARFVRWSGDVSDTNLTVTVTMDTDKKIVAEFAFLPRLLIEETPEGWKVHAEGDTGRGLLEYSSDLKHWTTLGLLGEGIVLSENAPESRFYRLRAEE